MQDLTNEEWDFYLEQGKKIDAICLDLGLSKDDARLHAGYIHVKAGLSGLGCQYFEIGEHEHEILALKIMLGEITDDEDTLLKKLRARDEAMADAFEFGDISDRIKALDQKALECGREHFFTSILYNRLRLHLDPSYRREKLTVYNDQILPKMSEYDTNRVEAVWQRTREADKGMDDLLNNALKK